jgi:hypothetical protein
MILLSQPPNGWDYRPVPPCLTIELVLPELVWEHMALMQRRLSFYTSVLDSDVMIGLWMKLMYTCEKDELGLGA